ncbi:Crp/Fnr family transcriptional regulator [Rhizobium metallidurans]|uniref:CRP-like cAMP-binding protein n=1 Tax=Rhizobium metallidurans TaxID=1265931 RepID=A0A7W6CVU4_9HYPH|nr:Crp/Fnr family transcriptional regulator [Rhizobium metallidurans]MBB3965389.1 CRP-like cAMP-binding protein [Rhizobium metallidurans]
MAGFEMTDIRNRILRALPENSLSALIPHLKAVELPSRKVLVQINERPLHAYFIESGLASMIAMSTDGESVEVGHIGFEGMSAAHIVLGADTTPNRTFMQVAGYGYALPINRLRQAADGDALLLELLLRYNHYAALQLANSALANARYSINERLSRWLLMVHDRLRRDDLPLTHEFLALMLGVRRSGITNELHILEGIHAIRATRGNVRILSREKLEAIAAGSYGTPEQIYEDLFRKPLNGPIPPR